MSVLVIAAIGVLSVLVLILVFRLHPLIALLVGSLFLLAATPHSVRIKNTVADGQVAIEGLSGGLIGVKTFVEDGAYLVLTEDASLEEQLSATLPKPDSRRIQLSLATPQQIQNASRNSGLSPDGLIWYATSSSEPVSITRQSKLISLASLATLDESRFSGIGGKLAEGFAKTFRKLGIPVTMAAIVGICLLESGAAARLVGALISLFGRRGTAPALTLSGFVLGIPVYFDNVFYLLLPLAKAVGKKRPEFYLTAVMAIIVGATMAHSLVPPTPGPLLVAEMMGVSIGKMMLGGLVVGGFAASVGFLYGSLCHRWVKLQPSKEEETSAKTDSEETSARTKIPLWLSAIPIGLPILALGGSEIVEFLSSLEINSVRWSQLTPYLTGMNDTLSLFNDPNLIFIGTAILAIGILRYYSTREVVGKSVAKGLSDAGTIVLLTCAGGAFGASLQQLGLADAIGERFSGLTTPWGMLATAFFLTTIIRAAQGSATVAMITSAAIVSPVMVAVELPFDPLYVALAIGCGSKPLPWMNDSGFWQVATMTGMSTSQTLKTFTVALTLMGITGFIVTLLGAWLLPLT